MTTVGPWGDTSYREYQKISNGRLICYRFDDSPPRHCLETSSCSAQPLLLQTRVSKTPNIYVEIQGWEDAVPSGGTLEHTSSIEHYEVSVYEVHGTSGPLKVGLDSVFTQIVDHSTSGLTLNISSGQPRLLCVKLEVKDHANNVR